MHKQLTLVLTLSLSSFLTVSSAQDVEDVEAAKAAKAKLDEATKIRVDTIVKHQQGVLQKQMAITLAHVQRVCDLSDEQVKKLQLATKGAVDGSLKTYREQTVQRYTRPRRFAAGNNVAVAIAANGALIRPTATTAVPGSIPGEFPIAREEIWTKTLGKVLTTEQKEAYDTSVRKRREFHRRLLVQATIALIDEKVVLDDSQRNKLTELSTALVESNAVPIPTGNFYSVASRSVLPALISKSSKEINAMFDESQQTAWQEFAIRFGQQRRVFAEPAFRAIAR